MNSFQPAVLQSKGGQAPLSYSIVSQSPTPRSRSTPASGGGQDDALQFFSEIFYGQEDVDTAVQIRVIRIGSLKGTCSCTYSTIEGSAIPGQKYVHTEGTITFGPGESMRIFEIPILADDSFDTTLEFAAVLQNPEKCALDPYMSRCRVLLMDADLFPSNAFKEEIETETDEALHQVGLSLLWAFICYSFEHIPTIKWKSILMVLLAQLGNAYYAMTIWLRIYLVDVCLNVEDPSTADRLIVRGDRRETALILGMVWVLPNVVLTGVDYFQMAVLEMGFNIRYHLRVNLFRKYLNYTAESRSKVPIQDLKTSMMTDIPDLVSDGYLIIFDILALFGKIVMVGIMLLRKHPESAIPMVVYPVLMLLYLRVRYARRLVLLAKTGEAESETQGWLIHADNAWDMVTNYKKRGFVVRKFEDILKIQRKLVMDLKHFAFWNCQLIPWITIFAIGTYIALAGHLVTANLLSLGSFLATVNVYKDLGDRFVSIHDSLQAMIEVIDPLSGLTGQFNLPTEVPRKIATYKARERGVLDYLDENRRQGKSEANIYDLMPITLRDITVEHSPSLSRTGNRGINIQAPQGCIIHVVGGHDIGKAGLLNLLTDTCMPSQGLVLASPHLRILHVAYEPLFVKSLGFSGNLTFGVQNAESSDPDPARSRRVLHRLGLDKDWMHELFEKETGTEAALSASADDDSEDDDDEEKASHSCLKLDDKLAEGEEEDGDDDNDWFVNMSSSERKRFQLARAFIYEPEVLVMHRPVDEMDTDLANKILGIMREYVDKRGLESPDASWQRPKTIIFSGGSDRRHPICDYVWRMSEKDGIIVEPRSA